VPTEIQQLIRRLASIDLFGAAGGRFLKGLPPALMRLRRMLRCCRLRLSPFRSSRRHCYDPQQYVENADTRQHRYRAQPIRRPLTH
jgi:hypothetical protein